MKAAIRDNEIFLSKDWQGHFDEMILTAMPYNYEIVEVADDIADKVVYTDFQRVNGELTFNNAIYDKRISEQVAADIAQTYKSNVQAMIAQRYTIADEIAIIRQRDSKPQEFMEYNLYCEECKASVKGALCVNNANAEQSSAAE